MPSIRVLVPPLVMEELNKQEFFELPIDLSEALRKEVASAFDTDVSHVEVLWIPLDYAVNTAPLAIEVMYSVLPDQNLDESARIALAKSLSSLVARFEGLPESVSEVTAWVLPQHNAVFETAKRET